MVMPNKIQNNLHSLLHHCDNESNEDAILFITRTPSRFQLVPFALISATHPTWRSILIFAAIRISPGTCFICCTIHLAFMPNMHTLILRRFSKAITTCKILDSFQRLG